MANNSMLFEHTQRFMREVMADRLRAEGFVSYKGEDIHWYRLVNNEVVQAIYFVTRHASLCSGGAYEICYGCHPMFISPIFQKSPYFYGMPSDEQMYYRVPELVPGSTFLGFHGLLLHGICNRPYRIPDVMIECPKDKNNGLDVLELVFPTLDKVQTPYACYEMHKSRRENREDYGFGVEPASVFVDEVIFWEDKELYEPCYKFTKTFGSYLRSVKDRGKPLGKMFTEELDNLLRQQRVFEEGRREEHLQFLKEREQKNFKLLEKYTGISLSKP